MTLKCENCGYEPSGRVCPACDAAAPAWARFCPYCGAALEDDETSGEGAPENRRLCPDGNCIGILDAEGRCVICGLSGPTTP
ncbi:MAG: hypothetical protein LBV21_04345 [Candidatus Adiutrix sp.]|jgi:predicted amidophosphoribosyltransferase|nr:hypothetical protein [Candidatus Adiutrix sp.]